jgi:hypothetical protein
VINRPTSFVSGREVVDVPEICFSNICDLANVSEGVNQTVKQPGPGQFISQSDCALVGAPAADAIVHLLGAVDAYRHSHLIPDDILDHFVIDQMTVRDNAYVQTHLFGVFHYLEKVFTQERLAASYAKESGAEIVNPINEHFGV